MGYTSDFLNDGTASANDATWGAASKAVDNSLSTIWATSSSTLPAIWAYDLGAGISKTAAKFRVYPYTNGGYFMKDFILYGSNLSSPNISSDGDWTSIYSGQVPNAGDWQEFTFTNTTAYRHYRVKITSNWKGTNEGAVYEFELMELGSLKNHQKAHWKCNDNAANTTVLDSLSLHNAIASANTNTIYDASGKINGCFTTGSSKWFYSSTHADFNFESGDASIAFWVKRSGDVPSEQVIICKRDWASSTEDGYAIAFTSNTKLRVHYYTDANFTVPSVGDGNWHHVVVTFNYTNHTSKLYYDGSYIGSASHTQDNQSNSFNLYIGRSDYSATSLTWDGKVDDVRFWKGYELDSTDVAAVYNSGNGTEDDFGDQELTVADTLTLSDSFTFQTNPDNQSVDDSLSLSDSWNLQVNPDEQEINELISLSENWDIHISNEELGIDESLNLSDGWSVLINPESQILSETLNISDSWIVNAFGTYYAKIRTDFRWLQTVVASISTSFSWLKAKFLNTDFRWLGNVNKSISTDFRWIAQPYTVLTPIAYTDIQIFINSVDVFLGNDVDLQSGNITHTIGNTSTASFVLARKHDDLDRTHLGVASQITNQNPVQIYIKGHLEFDGYISGISVDSESETVSISAKMDEPEDNRHSIELPLPSVNEKLHLYHCLVNNVQIDNPKEDTRSVIVGSNGRYWSGSAWVFYIEEALTFATDALAESYIDALLLSEESITNEFDRIFTKKSPSVTSRERNPQYYKGVKASLGTKITQQIDKYRLLEYITAGKGYYAQQIEDGTFNTKPNYSYFWAVIAKNARTGLYDGLYQYIGTSLGSLSTDLWVIIGATPMYQKIKDDIITELGYYYVGSAPYKEIYPKNGWLIPAQKWEDRSDGLYNVLDVSYDYRSYVQTVADLEYDKLKNIHGDILPVTSANLEITFDGYYFYNVKLLTRINVTNTTVANTYKNLNGFPVSVKTININFSSMKITLGCDNRLSQKEIDEIDAQMPDEESPAYLTQESAVRVYRKFDLKTWKYVS